MRDLPKINETPVGQIGVAEPQKIANCGRDVEAGAFVQIRLWPLVAKNILPVISAKWSRVFPLRVCDAIALADRNPASFARTHRRALICFFEPGNNARRFRAMAG